MSQVLGPEASGPKTPRVRRVRTQAEIESKTNAVRQRYNYGEAPKRRTASGTDDGKTLGKLKETISTGVKQATESGKVTKKQ